MEITDVRVRMVTVPEGKLRAYSSVVFDSMFVVHELRIVEGANGMFVAMPRRKTGEGEFKDLAHPITADARELIQKAVLEAYSEAEQKARKAEQKAEQKATQEAEPDADEEAEPTETAAV